MSEYFICPNCEARVPARARACPECGADEQAGWSMASSGLVAATGYEDATDEELLPSPHAERRRLSRPGVWLNRAIAAILLLTVASLLLPQGRMGLLLLPVVVVGLGALYYLTRARPPGLAAERQLYDMLLQRASGDRAMVERLLDLERRRHPEAPREQHLRDALYRWQRDG